MDNILYLVSNIKLDSVKLVAKCLKKRYRAGFRKIIFFESPESRKYETEHTQTFRDLFGDQLQTSFVSLNQDGSISPNLFSVFDEDGNKVVDLSSGPKLTTLSLYLASTLCKVKDIYCLKLYSNPRDKPKMKEGQDYKYIRINSTQGIEELAKLSYFDLIYYTEEIEALISRSDRNRSDLLTNMYGEMKKGIIDYYSDITNNEIIRSVINNLTSYNEKIIPIFLQYLRDNPGAVQFAAKKKIDILDKSKDDQITDTLTILDKFCRTYMRYGRYAPLQRLCLLSGFLKTLNDYRNVSSHGGNSNILNGNDIRIVINMQINALKRIHDTPDLWIRL